MNALGQSAASNELELSTGGAPAPGAPHNLTTRVDGTTLTLTWTAPAGGAPTSYVIEAGTGPGLSDAAVFDTNSPLSGFTHPAVPRGRVFYLRVRARNSGGTSAASNEVVVGPI